MIDYGILSELELERINRIVGSYITYEFGYNEYNVDLNTITIENFTFEKMQDDKEKVKEVLNGIYNVLGIDYELDIRQYDNNYGEYMDIYLKIK